MNDNYPFDAERHLRSTLASLSASSKIVQDSLYASSKKNRYRFLKTSPDAYKMLSSLINPKICSCSQTVYLHCYDRATVNWCVKWISDRIVDGFNVRINSIDNIEYLNIEYPQSLNAEIFIAELRKDLFIAFGV